MRRETLEFAAGIVLGGLLTAALPGLLDLATQTDDQIRKTGIGMWIVAVVLIIAVVSWHSEQA